VKIPADLRKEVALAEEMNWTLVQGKHLKWYDETGKLRLVTATTPSKGKRGIENTKARLKKCGISA
jgi:hypothetical protein